MLTKNDLREGRTYRAKKPNGIKPLFTSDPKLVNDRTILYVGYDYVQYDGPSVKFGSEYPRATIENFLKWADSDVTDELPPREYEQWDKWIQRKKENGKV